MTNRSNRPAAGAWAPGSSIPRSGTEALREAVAALAHPLVIVERDGRPAVASGGQVQPGVSVKNAALPLLAWVPALLPDQLGDAGFRADHGVRAAYVAGEMANGIASEQLVEAIARAGMLGVFGAAGLPIDRIEQAMERLEQNLGALPWGVNLIHSPDDPRLEAAAVELFLRRGLKFVSASAYLDLTLPVVRYRVTGIHRDASGKIVVPHRLMAKVSRVEVARKFLEPAPERFLAELVAAGTITAEQAALAAEVPMADDVTAEADSGGHTDNRPLVLLLPALQALRDEVCAERRYLTRPRIGAAGGLATPASIASAFSMGAAYVVTGSINQACREAGTSDAVRQMLAQASTTDVAMAPAADMFEMGVKVQVLTRGTLFAVRATRLYELYRSFDSLAALPAPVRAELEQKYFRCTLEQAWEGCRAFFSQRDPAQLARAAVEPKHQLALLFRSYLGQASHWANVGVADRKIDFQIWCGPAMGAFNAWARGSVLESWEARRAVVIARNLMTGAAVLTRVAALRSQGVVVPSEIEQFAPRDEAALDALLVGAPVEELRERPPVDPESSRGAATAEPIAIVGMGGMFPQAENLAAFWKLLRTAQDAVTDVPATHWSVDEYYDPDPRAPDKTYANRGAFLDSHGFDPTEFGIPPSILEATDTSQLLGLVAARMAMEDAGYGDGVAWDRSRASVLLGVTGTQELVISLGARLGHPKWRKALQDSGVDPQTADQVVERISQSYVGWQENSFPGLLGNVVAGRIANRLDFGGTNCVIDAACASSLAAVHLAVLELRSNRSDLVLTGGVDSLNDIFMHMCFSKTPALSASGDARPFSDRADGTLLGEAIGMLVLKRLSDAERDGDRIYATIRGVGASSDGRAKSIYAPLPSGQARALRSAYAEAGVRPRDIDLLEGHGTGTKAGDLAEFEALNAVYRDDSPDAAWCALGSVKSQIGHTKAAAGAAGMTKAALALHHKVLLPTLKIDAPNPALKIETSPFSLSTQTRPWLSRASQPRRAGVSSFGFGGSNFHLVLQEHGTRRAVPAWDGSVELLALSAADAPALLARLQEAAAVAPEKLAAFAAASRVSFRSSDAHRLVAVIGDGVLPRAIEKLQREPGVAFSLPEGAHYGVGPAAGKLAFVFPGQGSQHVNMARELACLFPEMLDAVEATPEVAAAIFPAPTFDASIRKRREEALTRTDLAQPAIGAISRGMLDVLARFGVKPQLVAGHSYGELVALHAAGVLGAAELQQVSALRGSLMAGNGEDRGTMLAVLAPLAQIEQAIAEEKLDVVLANRNGPSQGVLSGARDAIARAETVCAARGLRTARLSVGAAFHSPLVSGCAQTFRAGLEQIPFGVPSIPVVADATGAPYPADAGAARDLLGRQLALPVKFDAVVERLYADGARTFVEVGPRTALTGMVRAILDSRPHVAIAVDAQGKRGGLFDFALVLARVAAAGHDVRLEQWQRVPLPPRTKTLTERKQKMTVPLTGANYRAPIAPIPPAAPRPMPIATAAPVVSSTVLELLRANQEAVRALQAQAEQTARIHQTFLEGQLNAQQGFQALLAGQAHLSGFAPAPAPAPVLAPRPVVPALPVAIAAPVAMVAPVVAAPVKPAVDVIATLLSVVAEATGYPKETLELKMDMEADLGIDSIKRVEILSMLSKRIPGAPSVNPEKLGSLKTLQHVADFVNASAPAAPVAFAVVAKPVGVDAKATLLAVVSELTGYPLETLALEMDLEADLGIDSIKRVEILSMLSKRIPGAPSVNPEKLGTLKTLQQVLDFISASSPSATSSNGASAQGSASNGSASNGSAANGSASNGSAANGSAANGSAANGSAANGSAANGSAANGSAANGSTAHSASTNGSAANGSAANGSTAHGASTNGAFTNGVSTNGASTNGASVNGSAANGSAANGSSVNGASVNGASVNGASANGTARAAQVHRRVVVPVRLAAPATAPLRFPEGEILITRDAAGLADALLKTWTEHGVKARVIRDATDITGPVGALVVIAPDGDEWTAAGETSLKTALKLARAFGPRLREAGRRGRVMFAAISRRDGAFGHTTAQFSGNPLQGGLAGLVKTAADEWPEVVCRALDVSSVLSVSEAAAAIVNELGSEGPREVGLGPASRTTLALREAPAVVLENRVAPGDLVVVTGGARGVTAECARALAQQRGVSLLLLGRSATPTAEPQWMAAATDEASLKRALLEHAAPGERPTPKMLGEACRAVLAGREIRASLAALESGGVKVSYRSVDVRDEAALARVLEEARVELGPVRGLIHGAGVLRDKRIEDKRDDDLDQVLDTKLAGLRALMKATAKDDLRFVAFMASVSGRFGRRGQSDYAVANQALVSIAQAQAAKRPHCRVVALDWGPWDGGMVTPALRSEFEREGVALIPLADGARALCDEVQTAPGGPTEIVLGAGFAEESSAAWELAASYRLDPAFPVLADHQLAGKAVLPLAMTLEWFAQAAVQVAAGRVVQSIDDVRVLKGVTAPEDVSIWVGNPELTATGTRVVLELRSPRDQVHVRASARIGDALTVAEPIGAPTLMRPYPHTVKAIYAEQLFHGSRLEAIEGIDGISADGMTLRLRTHPTSERLMPAPIVKWATDPLVIDGVFQALILWCREQRGAPSLPSRVWAWRQLKPFPAGSVRATVRVREVEGAAITSDVDLLDETGEVVAQLEGCVFTVSPSLDRAFHPDAAAAAAAQTVAPTA